MTITWYGHSCFKIEDGGTSVVFDPYKPGSVPGLALPPLRADYCVCSHYHYDHFYPEGVELTGADPMIAQQQMLTFHDDNNGFTRGNNKVTMIQLGGVRFLHMGDIGHPLPQSRIEQLGRIDVLMVPVGGYYTIGAKIAKQMKDAMHPFLTLPMHYRGKGFGMDVLSTMDDFTRLCGDVTYFDTNVLDLAEISRPCTAVLKCPLKK